MLFRHRRSTRRLLILCILLALLFLASLREVANVRSAYAKRALGGKQELKEGNKKIYIASIHWNNEPILREHWIAAVVELAKHLGPDNVYVSVQESGSWDGSKDALRGLDSELEAAGIRRRVILDKTTHKDEMSKTPAGEGWIQTPRGRTELRRVPYLSRLRNLVLEPLKELAEQGQYFDKVLWLNDVVFNLDDILTLLNTRGGEYAAACSMDFSKPPSFYDTFALRDAEGHRAMMPTWPYFRARKSRSAIKAGAPVPVASCWNGVVSMDAKPYYDPAHPLHFRGVPDSLAEHHVEGSECCLVHADNPESPEKGVWLNPLVRVGYSTGAYDAVNAKPGESSVYPGNLLLPLWENRLRRWFTTTYFENSIVTRRLAAWRAGEESRREPGTACLVNEMQVLVENGWAHV